MPRYISLILEGLIFGLILGVMASFITLDFTKSVVVGMIFGVVARYIFDYAWELYNRITGKA